MSSKQVESLVKLRDALTMAAEATNEYIGTLTPPEIRDEKSAWNPERIVWKERNGKKEIFEVSEDYNNSEFRAMLKDIRNHGCAMSKDGTFIGYLKTVQLLDAKSGSKP